MVLLRWAGPSINFQPIANVFAIRPGYRIHRQTELNGTLFVQKRKLCRRRSLSLSPPVCRRRFAFVFTERNLINPFAAIPRHRHAITVHSKSNQKSFCVRLSSVRQSATSELMEKGECLSVHSPFVNYETFDFELDRSAMWTNFSSFFLPLSSYSVDERAAR